MELFNSQRGPRNGATAEDTTWHLATHSQKVNAQPCLNIANHPEYKHLIIHNFEYLLHGPQPDLWQSRDMIARQHSLPATRSQPPYTLHPTRAFDLATPDISTAQG